jgi:hypothetical protein
MVGPFTNTSYTDNLTSYFGEVLDMSHDNQMVIFAHYFLLANATSGCYGVDISYKILNQSFYQANFTTT